MGKEFNTPTPIHVEVDSIALRNAYPVGLRKWGMRITVRDYPSAGKMSTYVLEQNASDDKSDNNNFKVDAPKILEENLQYDQFKTIAHQGVGAANDIVVEETEMNDGDSVTLELLWTGKQDNNNTGCGGLFISVWTKAGGVMQKVADTMVNNVNDTSATKTVSTTSTGTDVQLSIANDFASNNFSYSGIVRRIFKRA